jgi:hypothetical protein
VLAGVDLGPDIVGLDKPAYTLTITFAASKTHELIVGSVTPIQNGYYSQLDGGPIKIVDKIGVDALLSLLTSPPYLATLTPVATMTSSPGPATSTPEALLTPGGTPGESTATPTP